MNRLTLAISAGFMLCAGTVAFGNDPDPMVRATPNTNEMMKDCVRKHQAGDVNLSKSELNRICKDEVKQHQTEGGSPPPQDTPKP